MILTGEARAFAESFPNQTVVTVRAATSSPRTRLPHWSQALETGSPAPRRAHWKSESLHERQENRD